MNKFIEVRDAPDGEAIYVKKDFLGWRVVEPIYLDGKIIWKNVFNKKGFFTLAVILVFLGMGYLAYGEQVRNYQEIIYNPCAYCTDCQAHTRYIINKEFGKNSSSIVNISFTHEKD